MARLADWLKEASVEASYTDAHYAKGVELLEKKGEERININFLRRSIQKDWLLARVNEIVAQKAE